MKKLLIILIGVISLNACNDVLDITPQDRISENDVWNDASLIRLYLNGTYAAAFPQGLYRNTQIGHATDELHSIKGSVYYYLITRGELTPDNVTTLNDYMNDWKPAYSTIRDANVFFEKIEGAPIADDIKTEMIGERLI